MKFDNLVKIVLNEADEIVDQQELNDDIGIDDNMSDDIEDVDSLEVEDTNDVEISGDDDEQKIDFLVKNSKVLNQNPNRTDAEKRAHAAFIVKNGYYDAFVDGINARNKADAIEDDVDTIGTRDASQDDVEALGSTYDDYIKMKGQEDEDAEEFKSER